MDVLMGETTVLVTLSRRNLEQLLGALDRGADKGLVRECQGTILMVEAEENERHYQELHQRQRGSMRKRHEARTRR
jgi:hypothetical protein